MVKRKGGIVTAVALSLGLAGHAGVCMAGAAETGRTGPTPEDLLARIEALERRLADLSALDPRMLDGVVGGSPGPADAGTAPRDTPPQVSQGGLPGPAGELDVSDEELGLALSRTLVDQGGLVLPAFALEIVPEVNYTYSSTSGLELFEVPGGSTIGFADVRQDRVEAILTGRLGLPLSSQIEVTLPYVYERVRGNLFGIEDVNDGAEPGDVQISLSKQLTRERGALPDLLASVTWSLPTGDAALGRTEPSFGDGFHTLQGTLTAAKSQDPLVYFGSVGYRRAFSDTISGLDVDPGDSVSVRLGTILAVSPQTSLRTLFDGVFRSETRVGGSAIPGSDDLAAALEIGVATVLTERMLLDVAAGFGVTDSAPDFRFAIALPYRF